MRISRRFGAGRVSTPSEIGFDACLEILVLGRSSDQCHGKARFIGHKMHNDPLVSRLLDFEDVSIICFSKVLDLNSPFRVSSRLTDGGPVCTTESVSRLQAYAVDRLMLRTLARLAERDV